MGRLPARFPRRVSVPGVSRDSVKIALGILAAGFVVVGLLTTLGRSSGQETLAFGPSAPAKTASSEAWSKPERAERQSVAGIAAPSAAKPQGSAEAPSSRPVAPSPTPAADTPADTAAPKSAPKPSPKSEPKPKPEPKPEQKAQAKAAPAEPPGLTAERIRALPPRATSASVRAALGTGVAVAALQDRYGTAPVAALRGQEPAGLSCSYYELAPSEPAPLVRICFDPSGFMLARDFVAPST